MQLRAHWLKKGVLLPVAAAMVVSSIALLVLLLALLSQSAKEEFGRDFTVVRAHWKMQLEHHASRLRSLGEVIAADPALGAAWRAADNTRLTAAATPLFTRLQQDYGLTSLTLVAPDGRAVLGLHHPGIDGERLRSDVLERAMASGTPQTGLELDRWNTLRLLGAVPWQQDGRRLGYLLLGFSLDELAGELDHLFTMHHLLALPPPRPEATALTLLPASLADPPGVLMRLLQRDRIQEVEQGVALERAEKWYFAGAIPLLDGTGNALGWLVTLRDVSDVRATLLLSAAAIALVTFAILVLLLAFLHRVTCQAERVLSESERELQQTLDQLEAAHNEWVESFDAIEQPIFLHDERYRVIRANRTYAERAGMSFHDLLGRPYWEVFPRNGGPLPGCEQAMHHGSDRNEEEVHLADGRVYISRSFPIRDHDGGFRFSIHVLQDVTELEHITSALQHEMRARRTISASNQALIHAASEEGLLQEVCRIAVEEGGYRLAWAAYKEDDAAHTLRPVGAAGVSIETLAQWPQQWSEQAAGRLLSAHAVCSGNVQVAQDLQHDERYPHSARLAREHDYASAAAFPLRTGNEILGVLFIAAATPHAFTTQELDVLHELAGDLAYGINALRGREAHRRIEQQHIATLEQLKSLLGNTVLALAAAVEARDPYTAGHQQKVRDLAMELAREMGWEEERIEALGIAALVHDVGNIYVPAEILSKPGRLSAVEFELVKNHPHIGYKILSTIDFPWPIAEMVLQHHEMLDGSGYPSGLKDGAILPEAQVIGIAGMIEAMSAHRPYRPALGVAAALEELVRHRGVKFDAQLVDACLRLFQARGYRLERGSDHAPR
ncbi:MAG: HD domain-containing phosphohydrolase [Pseudomonadota bacterium]